MNEEQCPVGIDDHIFKQNKRGGISPKTKCNCGKWKYEDFLNNILREILVGKDRKFDS